MTALATTDDLDARGVTVPDTMNAETLLDAASAVVREAAGYQISSTTSTITLIAGEGEYLPLPGAVVSVATVEIDGTAVTDYTVVDGALWRCGGWRGGISSQTTFYLPGDRTRPTRVEVTYTHGYDPVPDDVVDLVCSLVAQRVAQGYDHDPRVTSEAIDDYRVSYSDQATSGTSVDSVTRAQLRARFSTTAYVTGTRW